MRNERSHAVRFVLAAALVGACVASGGCSSSRQVDTATEDALPHGTLDAGAGADAGKQPDGGAPDAGRPPDKSFVFRPAPGDPGQYEVRITSGVVSQGTLTLHLATGGIPDVYGLYFRLTYDPAVLAFDSLTPSVKFADGGVSRAAERRGLLIAGITNKGDQASVRFDKGEEIAIVKFKIVGKDSTDVMFVDGACGAHDKYLQLATQHWVGGRLSYE